MGECAGCVDDLSIITHIHRIAGSKTTDHNRVTFYSAPVGNHAGTDQCITGSGYGSGLAQIACLIRIPKSGITIIITLLCDFFWPAERIDPCNFTTYLPGSVPAL